MAKRKKRKSKLEFSKVILAGVTTLTLAVVVVSFVLMFRTMDLSPLSYIITGCFAELASATGFYYWKAKNENLLKIGGSMPVEDTKPVMVDPPIDTNTKGGAVG